MNTLIIERQAPIRLVHLDTGPRNLLDANAIGQLTDALAPDAEAPVVVLSGRTDAFCAGLDTRILAAGERQRDELLAE